VEEIAMKNSALLKVLFAGMVCIAIICAPQPALAQHGGHMGGGGFHGGGFYGGGFHGGPGGFRGGYWRGGYWGYPRYGYGYGWGFGIGIGVGLSPYWAYPYPYYGYYPYYPYYPYYAPYPYPYYPYRPMSGTDPYNGDQDYNSQAMPSNVPNPQNSPNSSFVNGNVASPRPILPHPNGGTTYNMNNEERLVHSQLQQLPPERRRIVQNAIRALSAMPPDARQRMIDSDRFKHFSPEERKLLSDASRLPAPRAGTSSRESRQLVVARPAVNAQPRTLQTASVR
jgi:hypothetical protein